jgi:hypothetical protein
MFDPTFVFSSIKLFESNTQKHDNDVITVIQKLQKLLSKIEKLESEIEMKIRWHAIMKDFL